MTPKEKRILILKTFLEAEKASLRPSKIYIEDLEASIKVLSRRKSQDYEMVGEE